MPTRSAAMKRFIPAPARGPRDGPCPGALTRRADFLTCRRAVLEGPHPAGQGFAAGDLRFHQAIGTMANTASARKRIRQTERRTERNQARKSRMRTFMKKVEQAIAGGDKQAAVEALRVAQPEMQRAAGKGVTHHNTVARKLSRLSARIKALSAG